ncbi:sulfotransferase [Acidobacteriota bacterium]
MSNSNTKPILVTGSHRSGSTWTGRMIDLSSDIAYIDEPFSLNCGPGICKAEFEYWFLYICDENERFYLRNIDNCLRFKYNLSEEFRVAKSLRDLLRILRDYIRFEKYNILKKRPLVKDPIAVFSAEWLAKRYNMDVIVLIRHPAAFVSSLKKAKWTHPFDHFLQQPLLMQHHLFKYKSEIEKYSKTEKDIVDQAILLWNLIHHMILKYRENQPDWIFIKHEELSENPIEEFGKLYHKLGISFSMYIQSKIKDFCFAGPSKDNWNQLKRDSKSNIWTWKTRLTDEEIKRTKDKTNEIAREFYTEEDWIK